MKTFISKHFFTIIIILLVVVVAVVSYYRFMVKYDYLIGYEGECDPAINSCFVGCNDDACTSKYYYTEMIKYAHSLYKECGKDITGCSTASVCLSSDKDCSITYCDPKKDGEDKCVTLPELNTSNP